MFLSVFDIFKIGVGPSSSHTMGPMLAAARFVENAKGAVLGERPHLTCRLYGSLAYTGEGHGTIRAVLCGVLGMTPETYDRDAADRALSDLRERRSIRIGNQLVGFEAEAGVLAMRGERLKLHANALAFAIHENSSPDPSLAETYYSVGGGFVLTGDELAAGAAPRDGIEVPFSFDNAAQMLAMGEASGLSIAAMKRANELCLNDEAALDDELMRLWATMNACIDRGLMTEGVLPGGLEVKRRAPAISRKLKAQDGSNAMPLHMAVDWLSAFAMAVNEENAAGGQVVTAPTNGAAGVIPAVIRYYLDFVPGASLDDVPDMLLTAAAVGGLIKFNASISGAEVGCQGEVGSASAMAAAALCAAMGGTNAQVENAAEIALEHHLGMTCDPIRGLVQVPCIERNGMGAVKAVTAASLALHGDGNHIVPLDACIATMRETGRDMDERYKETSLGGLSVALPEC